MTEILYDYGLMPTIFDDYGHYLINRSLSKQIRKTNIEWIHSNYSNQQIGVRPCIFIGGELKRNVLSSTHDKDYSGVIIIDRRLRLASMIDFLIWEKTKYRAYIIPDTKMTPTVYKEEYYDLLGRLTISSLSKNGYSSYIHTDYVIVRNEKIYPASDKQRKDDIITIKRVHAILDGIDFLLIHDSNGSLFPNQKADYPSFFTNMELQKEKEIICNNVCDLSVVWQCGHARRNILRKNGIYRWDHNRFLSVLDSLNISPTFTKIISKMVSLSTSSTKDIDVPSDLYEKFPMLCNTELSSWIFVDFETDFQKCIYLCGYSSINSDHECLWADNISPTSEISLIHRIYERLYEHKINGGNICYYYAENRFWRERCNFHKLHKYMDLFSGCLDLYEVFVNAPIIIKGVFNFKLKTLASKLYELGQVPIQQPKGCSNGAESVQIASQYFRTHDYNLYLVLKRYNEFDCDILLHFLVFLRDLRI